jgi:hypothetical protein
VGGLTIDVGRAYLARTQLQGAVNAAALAGVSGLASGSASVSSIVTQYEALNNNPQWGTVTAPAPTVKCVNMMMPAGQSCSTSSILNAVQVTESVKVPTYFMKILGVPALTVGATATASPGEVKPWIVQIVLDTTPSMNDSDSNCTGASTAEQCALIGIQGLLGKTSPCPIGSSTCTAATSNIRVGLMSFPNILTTDAADNYGKCSGTPQYQLYSSPVVPTSGSTTPYTPITYTTTTTTTKNGKKTTNTSTLTVTYQSTYGASDANDSSGAAEPDSNGFYTNFYLASDKGGLNTKSSLVQAIGDKADSVNPCLNVPNGNFPPITGSEEGVTSFAGAIYAAETALLAEQAVYPKVNGVPTQTAIIFVSDGQANTLAAQFPAAANTTVSSNGLLTLTANGTYPSGIDACQQAITAAQYASNQLGIRVYSVAYGAENGGCLYNTNGSNSPAVQGTVTGGGDGTDVTPLILSGNLNVGIASITSLVPCSTMEDIASNLNYFYSDAGGINGVNTNCTSPENSTVTSLDDIFQGIYGSLTSARLIPNNAG